MVHPEKVFRATLSPDGFLVLEYGKNTRLKLPPAFESASAFCNATVPLIVSIVMILMRR